MVILEKTIKLSSKGQLTIPKQARELLGTDMVHLVLEADNTIRLEPAGDVAGSLNGYSRRDTDHQADREAAWEEAVHGKHARR